MDPTNQPHPLEPHVDALIKQGADSHTALEAGLVGHARTENAVKGLEPALDAIVLNTRPKDVQKVQIEPSQTSDDELAKAFWKMLRGPEGPKPSDDELVELIKPLIPKPVKGDDGDKPTNEELRAIIEPLIPEVTPAEPGHTPTHAELLRIIKPLIPKPVPGDDGATPSKEELLRLIKPLIPKQPIHVPDEPHHIVKKLRTLKDDDRLSYEDLKDRPNLETFRRGGGPGYLREISDVDTSTLVIGQALKWNGTKWIPFTPSSGGGSFAGTQEKTTTTIDRIVTTFSFAHTPSTIVWNGAIQTLNDDYTVSSLNITFTASAGTPQIGDKLLNIYA